MPVHLAAQKMLQLAVLGYPPLWTCLPPMLVDSRCVAAQESKHLALSVLTGSMHALVASPYKSAYNAAKHGVAGFTKTLALEVCAAAVEGVTRASENGFEGCPRCAAGHPAGPSRDTPPGTRASPALRPRLQVATKGVTCNCVCPGYVMTGARPCITLPPSLAMRLAVVRALRMQRGACTTRVTFKLGAGSRERDTPLRHTQLLAVCTLLCLLLHGGA